MSFVKFWCTDDFSEHSLTSLTKNMPSRTLEPLLFFIALSPPDIILYLFVYMLIVYLPTRLWVPWRWEFWLSYSWLCSQHPEQFMGHSRPSIDGIKEKMKHGLDRTLPICICVLVSLRVKSQGTLLDRERNDAGWRRVQGPHDGAKPSHSTLRTGQVPRSFQYSQGDR